MVTGSLNSSICKLGFDKEISNLLQQPKKKSSPAQFQFAWRSLRTMYFLYIIINVPVNYHKNLESQNPYNATRNVRMTV